MKSTNQIPVKQVTIGPSAQSSETKATAPGLLSKTCFTPIE
jgi:hypothetical protein